MAARASPPSPDTIQSLALEGVDIDAAAGSQGLTAMHLAILQQYDAAHLEQAVAALLAAGASTHLPTAGGDSPLHLCAHRARRGQAAVGAIELLLRAGSNPDALNAAQETPLHILVTEPLSAAAEGALKMLLANGASASLPCRGRPPLHSAAAFADGKTACWVIEVRT